VRPYKIIITGLLLFFHYAILAQEGIRFTALPWDSAKVMAARTHRLIFVDVFTDWCRPCKLMDQEVFSQSVTGAFFNEHFINIRMNAERGEGIRIAATYQVPSYPYYLFVDPGGKLIYQDHGFCNGNQLVAKAEAALDARGH
jgi:thiol:disulfide interchange protein